MDVWIFIFFCLFALTLTLADLNGEGTTIAALPSWISSYQQISPLSLDYNISGAPMAIRQMIDHTTDPYIDFVFSEAAFPNASDLELDPDIQIFPIVGTTIVPQVNIPALRRINIPLVFSRDVVAGIFMGNITNWRDPQILWTNQALAPYLPDTNISVIYRNDQSGNVKHLTSVLSVFSSEWQTQYGVVNLWPTPLRNLPNFIRADGNLGTHATIITTPNSIGYVELGVISRDPSIRLACIYDKWGEVVCPTDASMAAAVSTVVLNPGLPTTSIYIDSNVKGAWTSGLFIQTIVHSQFQPERCAEIKSLFKFFYWTLTDATARAQTTGTGLIPIPSSNVDQILNIMKGIECDGDSVLALTSTDSRTVAHEILIILNSLFLAFVVVLSVIHFYLFRSSTINTVYSGIFLIGSGINLSAPYAWNMIPDNNGVCVARAWLTSLGLALLLGSLFARTWQLRDIYYLQKKTVENLQTQITVRSSLTKLGFIMMSVLILNLLILGLWTAVDPYTATLRPADNELHGTWTCVSAHLSVWMFMEVTLLAFLIAFGVYVIYRTWSFQRASVVRETRWVLMVLYNIVLNVVAAFPVAVITHANDESLSMVMIASLMFSGGGIVLSFLLPRILRYFRVKNREKNSHSRDSETPSNGTAKLRVRIRDHSQDPIATHPETTIASRIISSSLSGYNSQSSLLAPNLDSPNTPTYSPNNSGYSPNMTAINEESSENITLREMELLAVKHSGSLDTSRISISSTTRKLSPLQTSKGVVISETNNNSDEEDEDAGKKTNASKRRLRELDGEISLSPSRNLLITHEEQHLLETSERGPSPAPVQLLWSSNPLAGTETSTPMEEDVTPMQ